MAVVLLNKNISTQLFGVRHFKVIQITFTQSDCLLHSKFSAHKIRSKQELQTTKKVFKEGIRTYPIRAKLNLSCYN